MKTIKCRQNKPDALARLHENIRQCRLCTEDFGFEPRPIVFGRQDSKIMQISQAPSKTVYETGKPFNDASGKRLREKWYEISDEDFYNPTNFYIVSVAHCFPGKAKGGGDKSPPKICGRTWLLQEMALVDNKIYIIIGQNAAEFLFPGEKVTALAFEDKLLNGKPAYIMPHPSPLNMKWFRDNPDFEAKRLVEIRKEIHRLID